MSTKYIINNSDNLLIGQTINGELNVTSAITASVFYGDGSNLSGVSGAFTGGTQYILVKAEGTDIENAAELQAAYDLAVSLSASSTNRITIVASPGNYNFSASTFTMDTKYIDLVSLDGNRSIVFNATLNTLDRVQGSISVTANNVFVKGVNVLTKSFKVGNNLNNLIVDNCEGGNNSFGYIDFGEDFTLSGTFINCKGGNSSFGVRPQNSTGASTLTLTISGKFTNCEAGTNSFGTFVTAIQTTTLIITGTFINCKAGQYSFGVAFTSGSGGSITISGARFIDCESTGRYSFGYSRISDVNSITINNSTLFENCKSFNDSFGSKLNNTITTIIVISQTTFKNCEVYQFGSSPLSPGDNSFGYESYNFTDSTIINCIARDNSFGGGIGSSTIEGSKSRNNSFGYTSVFNSNIKNCVSGNNSFGVNYLDSCVFENCTAGNKSFGGESDGFTPLTVDGMFINCKAGNDSFGGTSGATISSGSTFINCQAEDNSFAGGGGGFLYGTFTNCVGGIDSFGGNGGTLEAKLYRCQLTSGTFETPTGSGKIVLGIDGDDDIINLPL
jgi:hypothetical protein